MTRYFKRSGSAWIVGGGLHGQWVPNHRGLFIQNRSAALGNAVSGGTGLAKRFRWANDSAHVQEQHCERGLQVSAAGSTPEDRIDLVLQAAREQQFGDELLNDVRDALLGKKNASRPSGPDECDAAADGCDYHPVERQAWQPPLRAGYARWDGQASQGDSCKR